MYKSYDQLGSQPEKNRDIMNVLELNDIRHKQHVLATNKVVCVDVYADWCSPCQKTAPEFSIVANNYSKEGACAVVKYNWDRMTPAERQNIGGIPTFFFYVNGQEVDKVIGADILQVESKLKSLLQNSSQPVYAQGYGQGGPQPQQMNNQPYGGSGYETFGQELNQGPQHNRNSIRQTRSQLPQEQDSMGVPYQSDTGTYHRPYGQR